MVDYSKISYMFTYATSSTSGQPRSPALIFTCMEESQQEEFTDTATPMKLAEHPLVKSIMGDTYFVEFISHTKKQWSALQGAVPKWVFHLNFRRILAGMDEKKYEEILLKMEDKPLGTGTLKQIMDSCYLPHKYVMSCTDCATSSYSKEQEVSDHDCIIKQIVQRTAPKGYRWNSSIDNGVNTEELAEDFELKNGKTQINDFVYISPAMTGGAGIHARVRGISKHFFTEIQGAADCRSEAQVERKRFKDFREKVCITCGVHKTCEQYSHEYSQRTCEGPYPKDQKEMVRTIIQGVKNPFTVPQIRYLLANSGLFYKRYKRCIVYGTLSTDPQGICFAIRRKTCPWARNDMKIFTNFKEAQQFIKEYGSDSQDKYITPLTKELLATLYEAVYYNYSPTYTGRWRSTSYPVLYIEPYLSGFRVNYSYHGKGTCGFTMKLNSIQDIYENFGYYRFLEKVQHSLRKHY